MGANLQVHTVTFEKPKADILKRWEEGQESDRYENGHSYSGGIGMLRAGIDFRDMNLPSNEAAHDFISDNHDKGSQAIAVSYTREKDGKKFWAIGGWCAE